MAKTYVQPVTVAQFRPESYGAVRDGSTDDTAAIKSCVQAACDAAAADGTYYAKVQFTPGVYLVSGATTQSSTYKGNAQIPLPVMPVTGQKMILELSGVEAPNSLWHWNQTTVQRSGVVLKSTLAGSNDGTWGEASVIGGPTPAQGYGAASVLFSNMQVVVRGVSLMLPNNPAVCGFDFRGVAQMSRFSGGVLTNATPATKTSATNAWQFGLACPQNNNNAISTIDQYSCEGMNYGLVADEHLHARDVHCIYCVAGVETGMAGQTTGHGILIDHLLVEASEVGVGALGSFASKLNVTQFDYENISFAIVNDVGGSLLGTVRCWDTGAADFLDATQANGSHAVRGAVNLRVYELARQPGNVTAPSIPATTVALRNPFFRDAFVHVTGGTLTSIQLTTAGGSATSVGVTSGMVFVPTGAYITLNYSVAPSWKWTLQ
jgi:hypothetical protein